MLMIAQILAIFNVISATKQVNELPVFRVSNAQAPTVTDAGQRIRQPDFTIRISTAGFPPPDL